MFERTKAIWELAKLNQARKGNASLGGVMLGFVLMFVGVLLLGPLQSTVVSANINGTAGTVANQLPIIFAIGLIVAGLATIIGAVKGFTHKH